MAGGYPDDAHNPMWTMHWWAIADTFVYFSHHRVSVPPREWINAGHRQGCKVLGTFILERENDRYRVLTGEDTASIGLNTNTVSTKYADYLIDLCELRGFDGYILNFEIGYENPKNAQLLGTWVAYLRSESRRRLGAGRSVIMWYEAVNVDGILECQNTLSEQNSAFFIASDAFYTNYRYDAAMIRTAKDFVQSLVGNTRSASDLVWGIDIWGRGTYEGGGYGTCRALKTIDAAIAAPQAGFSAALFGPAYLWENNDYQPHDRAGWWDHDTLFWVGRNSPQETQGDLRTLNTDKDTKKQVAGSDFHPIKDYFPFQPQTLPFSTNFSLGAGTFFNINGRTVQPSLTWSDHEWVAPLPDLAMPCSYGTLLTRPGRQPVTVNCQWISDRETVWAGAHSLQLSCPLGPRDLTYAPLFTIDLGEGTNDGCTIVYEIMWYECTSRPSWPRPKVYQGGKLIESQYQERGRPTAGLGNWRSFRTFYNDLHGLAEFGADLYGKENGGDPATSVILGALSVRAVSGTTSPNNKFDPHNTYIDATNLHFDFNYEADAYGGTLLWSGGIRPLIMDGSASNTVWPALRGTLLDHGEIMYEVTTYLVTGKGDRTVLAWGTTSLGRQTISWSDSKIREQIHVAETEQNGFIAFKVQAVDGAGWYAGTATELRVSFTDRRVL
ncbi:glycoside hydrolase family 85 protein [Calocera cornea HHB12733]|uniref:Glycoside hydrolase family 85 protein n=1 Tax=Calocera cornea HHB12733 TaxID=1353952 RepID=A0A165HC23_9BASI|nr:glycoside hydrolase family 85 protein [Calocera cornea HHB12733]